MVKPIEIVIIRAQQNFEIAGGLNSVQIEIEDDKILNILKRYKIIVYRLTPLGLLFPASAKNDNEQILLNNIELNNIKKALINSKIYGLLGIIDLKKMNNWEEIKGHSLWINVTFVEQKETNNSKHLCFPFTTSILNDISV